MNAAGDENWKETSQMSTSTMVLFGERIEGEEKRRESPGATSAAQLLSNHSHLTKHAKVDNVQYFIFC